ncbi:SRPBCC family protein [Pseudarthrobacter sp. YS3]|uniref:SRPBCC family protein n=1 Tax=Pseudarthrobacter sp. YS3 TaxID=3453718 RepID=UPI003EEDAAB1
MKPITGEILIDAPNETVFDFVADECNEPLYNRNMIRADKLTPGPIGVGTRFAAVMGKPRGTSVTIECTAFSRPRTLGSHSRTNGMDIEGNLTFTPEADRTKLSWVWKLHPHGALRLLGPVLWAMGSRQERANWTALKQYLETARS